MDRTITSLQSCRCEDNCSSEKCLCGNISLRCWYDEEGKLIPEFNYAGIYSYFKCHLKNFYKSRTFYNKFIMH